MITIRIADVNIGIDNCYEIAPLVEEWITDEAPDFTVRVEPEEMIKEDAGRNLKPEYLEFICAYRHIAERMPSYDAFVFHGVAMGMGGLAYIFTAPSGTGKTFHGKLWYYNFEGKAWFLNGDKPIIRRTPAGFTVCGTPWRGKERYGLNAELPVQGVCVLHRGPEISISPVEPQEILPWLARQTYIPRDPAQAAKTLELLDAFCAAVPAWSMICAKDTRCATLSYETMRPREGDRRP